MVRMHDPDGIAQALADPSRRSILEALRLGRKSVSELCEITGLKQPNLSNHLAKMRAQNVVHSEREGRFIYYSLEAPFAEVLLRMHAVASRGARRRLKPGDSADHGAGADGMSIESSALASQLLQYLLAGDEAACSAVLNNMLSANFGMAKIYLEVFQPALRLIGDLYEQGKVDEAREHVASAIVERMMARVAEICLPAVHRDCHAVLGCVAGNLHSVGVRMLADSLHADGWKVTFVGADTPTNSFIDLVALEAPDLVVISVSLENQLAETRNLLAGLRNLRDSGQMFRTALGGHFKVGPYIDLRIDEFIADDLDDFTNKVNGV